jgi:hypothetical protein
VEGDNEFAVRLPLTPKVQTRLISYLRTSEDRDFEFSGLGERMAEAISRYFSGDEQPPSHRQIVYAEAICFELGLQLPTSCMKSKDSMQSFISANSAAYQNRKIERLNSLSSE